MNLIRRLILAAVLIAGFAPAMAQVPAPVPALPDAERRTSYSISGTTCACSVGFALYGDSTDFANWVEVWINGVRYDYNDASHGWTITSPSGSLATLARPITNAVLTFNAVQTGTVQIVGARRPRRASQFNENAGVSARNLNQVFTDIISQNREIWDKTNDVTGRAILGVPGETINTLPPAATRANTTLGFDSLGQLTFYSPASAVTSATNINFLQSGLGAVSITLASIWQDKIFTPEMFASGAISAAINTAVGSVPDATLAIQAAITRLCLVGGGTVQLGPRAYALTASVNIPCNNIYIRGSGTNATQIVHKMTGPSTAFYFSAGAAILSNTGISDLSIQSADTTNTKVAVTISDASQFAMRNINIAHYPVDGSLYRGTGGSGTGIQIRGRELSTVENVQITADQPINIQINPNNAGISMDSWVFRDLTLVAALSGSPTTSVITVDTGVAMFNTRFEGHQNWIGGLDGFHWVDTTSAVASLGLTLSGIKAEQSPIAATGYTVNIQKNAALLGLKIVDGIAGDRNGIKLRNVATASIDNFFFGPPGASVGLNIDSTVALTEITNSYWTSTATATITGQNVSQRSNNLAGLSTAIPSTGRFTNVTPLEQFSQLNLSSLTASAAVAADGGKNLVSVTNTGSGNNVLATSPTLVTPALGTIASGNLAAGTGYLVSGLADVAWPTYACALASEAGGALGSGNTLTCAWKSIGKTACVTGTIVMGASGIGTATQVSVSLPSTATRNAILFGKNTSSGLGVMADIGSVAFTKAILNVSSTGAVGVANSQTTVFTGCYEQT